MPLQTATNKVPPGWLSICEELHIQLYALDPQYQLEYVRAENGLLRASLRSRESEAECCREWLLTGAQTDETYEQHVDTAEHRRAQIEAELESGKSKLVRDRAMAYIMLAGVRSAAVCEASGVPGVRMYHPESGRVRTLNPHHKAAAGWIVEPISLSPASHSTRMISAGTSVESAHDMCHLIQHSRSTQQSHLLSVHASAEAHGWAINEDGHTEILEGLDRLARLKVLTEPFVWAKAHLDEARFTLASSLALREMSAATQQSPAELEELGRGDWSLADVYSHALGQYAKTLEQMSDAQVSVAQGLAQNWPQWRGEEVLAIACDVLGTAEEIADSE